MWPRHRSMVLCRVRTMFPSHQRMRRAARYRAQEARVPLNNQRANALFNTMLHPSVAPSFAHPDNFWLPCGMWEMDQGVFRLQMLSALGVLGGTEQELLEWMLLLSGPHFPSKNSHFMEKRKYI